MLYKRRCNATQGKGVEAKEERGERGEGRKREWLGLGRSSRANRHGVLYPQIYPSPAPDSARSADSSSLASVTPPILHSSFSPSHLAQIEIHTQQPLLNATFFFFFSFTSSLSLRARASPLPFPLLQLVPLLALLPYSLGTFFPIIS
jgi:hypothetical protein